MIYLMKTKFLLLLLVFVLFSSCAIHVKFPFICFKKECVLGQLGYYGAKESFRKVKINSSIRKKKRTMNRSKHRAKKDKSFPPNPKLVEAKTKDSLAYVKGFSGLCNQSIVIFNSVLMNDTLTKNYLNDTIIINYLFDEREPSPSQKNEIKLLIEKIGVKQISNITIKECHNRSVLSEYEIYWLEARFQKINKYLKKLDIPSTKITLDD